MTGKTALEGRMDAELKEMVRGILAESPYPLSIKQIKRKVNETTIPYRVSSAKILRIVNLLNQDNIIEIKHQTSRANEWGMVE